MRLGIFGGTFDPIHIGHLIVADHLYERLRLGRVLFIPAGEPWFKTRQYVTDGHHRLEMVTLAITANLHLEASDVELRRTGPTYTVDTLTALREEMGDEAEFFVIAGSDALNELHRWHRVADVLDMATVVGVGRPSAIEVDKMALDSIRDGASDEISIIDGPLIGVSATDIRQRVSQGRSIRYLVPRVVEEYIYRHGLYRGEEAI